MHVRALVLPLSLADTHTHKQAIESAYAIEVAEVGLGLLIVFAERRGLEACVALLPRPVAPAPEAARDIDHSVRHKHTHQQQTVRVGQQNDEGQERVPTERERESVCVCVCVSETDLARRTRSYTSTESRLAQRDTNTLTRACLRQLPTHANPHLIARSYAKCPKPLTGPLLSPPTMGDTLPSTRTHMLIW
jgi:hypothetical protein